MKYILTLTIWMLLFTPTTLANCSGAVATSGNATATSTCNGQTITAESEQGEADADTMGDNSTAEATNGDYHVRSTNNPARASQPRQQTVSQPQPVAQTEQPQTQTEQQPSQPATTEPQPTGDIDFTPLLDEDEIFEADNINPEETLVEEDKGTSLWTYIFIGLALLALLIPLAILGYRRYKTTEIKKILRF